jgi:hypothetical protein
VEGEGECMDKKAVVELYYLLIEIFDKNKIRLPIELNTMVEGAMMNNRYMVIENMYSLLKMISILHHQGKLDITDDEWRRIRELVDKIVYS